MEISTHANPIVKGGTPYRQCNFLVEEEDADVMPHAATTFHQFVPNYISALAW